MTETWFWFLTIMVILSPVWLVVGWAVVAQHDGP